MASAKGVTVDFKTSVERATRAMGRLAAAFVSQSFAAGYRIENKRGRNKLVPLKGFKKS